jgi:hypothetical protein
VKDGVWKIGEGDAAKPWWSGIQEQPIKEYMEAKNYATPDEAARAAWNAHKMNTMAPEVQAVIEGKATPEQMNSFYSKLGRPEAPDKYNIKPLEGTTPDEGLMKFGKELFFELGANDAKAQAAYEKWEKHVAGMNAQVIEQERVANETALKTLETKWGADLEANKAAGLRAMQALGLDAAVQEQLDKNIGVAAVVELLAAIGKKSAEGGFVSTGKNTDPDDPTNLSPEQASQRITTLQADPVFWGQYTNSKDPGHANAVQKMERLYAKSK